MAKLKDGLAMIKRIAELEQALRDQAYTLDRAEQDRDLLADAVMTTAEFGDWLMGQDVSSSHMRRPSGPKGTQVEDADDQTLALAWAAQVDDANGLRRLR